jgi:hypothetical protein
MGMGKDDSSQGIEERRPAGPEEPNGRFHLKPDVRGCVDEKNLPWAEVGHGQRGDEPPFFGLAPNAGAIRAGASKMGNASILGCAEDLDDNKRRTPVGRRPGCENPHGAQRRRPGSG